MTDFDNRINGDKMTTDRLEEIKARRNAGGRISEEDQHWLIQEIERLRAPMWSTMQEDNPSTKPSSGLGGNNKNDPH